MLFDVLRYARRVNAKTTDIRITGTRKSGFTYAITAIEPSTHRIIWVVSKRAFGRFSSMDLHQRGHTSYYLMSKLDQFIISQVSQGDIFTYPTSFEKRLKIRPDGFVSKNRIRVEMRPLNIPSCNC